MYACAICPQIEPAAWPDGLRPLDDADVIADTRGPAHIAGTTGGGREILHLVRQYADTPETLQAAYDLRDAAYPISR